MLMDMASPLPVKAKKKKRKVFDCDECCRFHLAVPKGCRKIPRVTTLASFEISSLEGSLHFFRGEVVVVVGA